MKIIWELINHITNLHIADYITLDFALYGLWDDRGMEKAIVDSKLA